MNNYIVRSYRDVIVITKFAITKFANYIVRSYRDVIVITKFAITKFATRRASKAQSIGMY